LRQKKAPWAEALLGQLEPVYRLLLQQQMAQARLLWEQVEEMNPALLRKQGKPTCRHRTG
jgi:hypothetical protein